MTASNLRKEPNTDCVDGTWAALEVEMAVRDAPSCRQGTFIHSMLHGEALGPDLIQQRQARTLALEPVGAVAARPAQNTGHLCATGVGQQAIISGCDVRLVAH